VPKRNRHREQLKAQIRAGTLPVSPPSKSPAKSSTPTGDASKASKPKDAKPKRVTVPLSSEKRKEKERHRRQRHEAHLKEKVPSVLEVLSVRWPLVFPRDPSKARPWAIGLFKELIAQNLEFSRILIRETLKRYTKTEGYQKVLIAGGPRYDLAGTVKGEVTEEETVKASDLLQKLKEKMARTQEKAHSGPSERDGSERLP